VLILHLCRGEWGAAATGVKHNSRLLLLSHNFYIIARVQMLASNAICSRTHSRRSPLDLCISQLPRRPAERVSLSDILVKEKGALQ
jgi:hypothetical protein